MKRFQSLKVPAPLVAAMSTVTVVEFTAVTNPCIQFAVLAREAA
jgi:hypothetical protein